MPRSALTAAIMLLSAVSAGYAAITSNSAAADCEGGTVKARGASCSAVATAQKPATVEVQTDPKGGAALEVTARPVSGDPSSAYLVQVFINEPGRTSEATSKLLGTFAFFPARVGQAETFVIPKPKVDDPSRSDNLTLSIKLIPANPARDIKDAAVEILGARVVE